MCKSKKSKCKRPNSLQNFPNVTDVMDVSFPLAQVNGTKYFGYKKSDSMFMEVRVSRADGSPWIINEID